MRVVSFASLIVVLGSWSIAAGTVAPPINQPPAATEPLDARLFTYDKSLPLDVQVVEREEFEGYTRIDASYRSPIEGRVPAYLFEPSKKPAGKYPAIIFMHGLPGGRAAMVPLAAAYARVGVMTVCLTAPFSRTDLSYRPDPELVPAPRYDEYDRREMIQVAMDVSRAIDWLSADPRVDPKRIGFAGFSFGGSVGVLMAAIEPRFRALGLMSPTSGLVSWSQMAPDAHPMKQRFLELPADVRDRWIASMGSVEPVRWLAAARSVRPLLIQLARHDEQVQPADHAQILAAARTFATVKWYESGHVLPPDAAADQAVFLAGQLGFDAKGFVPPPTKPKVLR